MKSPSPILMQGCYSVAEAAFYAGVRPASLTRWLFGGRGLPPVVTAAAETTPGGIVSFLDFVQVLAIRDIRRAPQTQRLSLAKIRQAVREAENRYQQRFIFAQRHRVYAFHGNILIRLPGDHGDELITLNRRGQGQRHLVPIAEPFMRDLGFDADGFAANLTVTFETYRIRMAAGVRFGQPILMGTGYTPFALVDALDSEGSEEAAARACGVPVAAIRAAKAYVNSLPQRRRLPEAA